MNKRLALSWARAYPASRVSIPALGSAQVGQGFSDAERGSEGHQTQGQHLDHQKYPIGAQIVPFGLQLAHVLGQFVIDGGEDAVVGGLRPPGRAAATAARAATVGASMSERSAPSHRQSLLAWSAIVIISASASPQPRPENRCRFCKGVAARVTSMKSGSWPFSAVEAERNFDLFTQDQQITRRGFAPGQTKSRRIVIEGAQAGVARSIWRSTRPVSPGKGPPLRRPPRQSRRAPPRGIGELHRRGCWPVW